MSIEVLTKFFMWCTIVNGGLLTLSFLICACAGGFVYRMHSKWFPMPRETFNVVIYAILGVFKSAVVFFNVVPYVVLLIIG